MHFVRKRNKYMNCLERIALFRSTLVATKHQIVQSGEKKKHGKANQKDHIQPHAWQTYERETKPKNLNSCD